MRRVGDWDPDRLRSLAAEYGTPVYVVDLDRIRENYRRIDAALDARVLYAAKANASPAVLSTLADAGAGLEVASPGELRRATRAGVSAGRIHYTAVNPPDPELDRVVEFSRSHPTVTVTAGARDTLDRLADRGFEGRLALRVNPGTGAGHHEAVVTGADRQFGIPLREAPAVLAAAADRFEVVGLHAHVGSGVLDDDLAGYAAALGRVGALARSIEGGGDGNGDGGGSESGDARDRQDGGTDPAPESLPGSSIDLHPDPRDVGVDPDAAPDLDLEFVDVGGGFGVPYREEADPLDLSTVRAVIGEVTAGVDAGVVVEPGRYVAADAGVLLTRVNTVRPGVDPTGATAPGTSRPAIAGVDAGLHTLLRPALFDAHHPVENLAPGAAERDAGPVTVVGPVCSGADTLCAGRPLPRPHRGDLLAVGNAGAYGRELATRFHARALPAEVAVERGTARLSRPAEAPPDLGGIGDRPDAQG